MKQQLTLEARNLVSHLQQVSERGAMRMDRVFDVAVLNSLWFMFAGHRFEYNDEKLREVLTTVHEAFRQAIISQCRVLCVYVCAFVCLFRTLSFVILCYSR